MKKILGLLVTAFMLTASALAADLRLHLHPPGHRHRFFLRQ